MRKRNKKYRRAIKARTEGLTTGSNNTALTYFSKRMRYSPTQAEKMFRDILKEKRIPYVEQVPFEDTEHKYIFDFVVAERWVVEIDGGYHTTVTQQLKDKERDKVIQKLKFKEKRFTNEDIMNYSRKFHNWLNGMNYYAA